MLTDVENMFMGELTFKEVINEIFNKLEKDLLDRKEISLDFAKVKFISVYFLERLESFVNRAKDLHVEIKLINVQPSIYKVFQVGRVKHILNICI